MKLFVLIHSPLVGAFTWALVADELRRRRYEAVTPSLYEIEANSTLYWQRHLLAVRRSLEAVQPDRTVILVAHSGAGPLLPALRQELTHPVAGYVFVDAGLPKDNASRLDQFGSREEADKWRKGATNGLMPTWTENDLTDIIPDVSKRRSFVAELRPTPLAIYEEPLPVFAGWPDAPCGYIQLSAFYGPFAARARQLGWPCRILEAGHFHMLVDPGAVTDALIDVAAQMVDLTP